MQIHIAHLCRRQVVVGKTFLSRLADVKAVYVKAAVTLGVKDMSLWFSSRI